MRFLSFDLGGPRPDECPKGAQSAYIIRLFRNKLTETGTLKRVMKAFKGQLRKKGYIPMAGEMDDASLVPAPKQRNTDCEKDTIKAGRTAGVIWPDAPLKAAQKDTNALDAEDRRQGTLPPRRNAAADDRGAELRLQISYQHRSALRLHP